MARRKQYLTATTADGTTKTIGPTTLRFSHYWRIVAELDGGGTAVFWGHTATLAEAKSKRTAAADAARIRGWRRYDFEIAAVTATPA